MPALVPTHKKQASACGKLAQSEKEGNKGRRYLQSKFAFKRQVIEYLLKPVYLRKLYSTKKQRKGSIRIIGNKRYM